jgi:hypothetical protein
MVNMMSLFHGIEGGVPSSRFYYTYQRNHGRIPTENRLIRKIHPHARRRVG